MSVESAGSMNSSKARNYLSEPDMAAFRKLRISEQCSRLDVDCKSFTASEMAMGLLDTVNVGKMIGQRIEDFALDHAKLQGWHGDSTEGAVFDFTYETIWRIARKFKLKAWKQSRKHINRIHPVRLGARHLEEIGIILESINSDEVLETHRTYPFHGARSPQRQISEEGLLVGYGNLSEPLIRGLIELDILGVYGGWPDLTLYKDNRLLLVEVKSKRDRMTEFQVEWFRQVQPYLGIESQVWHVDQTR